MNDKTTENNDQAPLLGSASSEGLGLMPERDRQPRMYTATGPVPEAGHWYSPAAVREMLAAEREARQEVQRRLEAMQEAAIRHQRDMAQADRKLGELRTLIQRVAKYPASVDCADTLLRHDVMRAAGPPETWKA